MAQPRKGDRTLINVRAHDVVRLSARRHVKALGVTMSDYIATLLALDLGMDEHAPLAKEHLSPLVEIDSSVEVPLLLELAGGKDSPLLGARPATVVVESGHAYARDCGTTLQTYVATLVANDLGLHEYAPLKGDWRPDATTTSLELPIDRLAS